MTASSTNVRLGNRVYIAPTAYVGGDVHLGDDAIVLHHAVIRGDIAPIRIGQRTNIQDAAVLHTRYGVPLDIADGVIVGHRAVVHCRRVEGRTLVGIGAILLDDVEVGECCVIAAGAVVRPGTRIPPGTVYGGVPARPIRDVTQADLDGIDRILASYVALGARYEAGEFPNLSELAGDRSRPR